jgi:hypothetical protein
MDRKNKHRERLIGAVDDDGEGRARLFDSTMQTTREPSAFSAELLHTDGGLQNRSGENRRFLPAFCEPAPHETLDEEIIAGSAGIHVTSLHDSLRRPARPCPTPVPYCSELGDHNTKLAS